MPFANSEDRLSVSFDTRTVAEKERFDIWRNFCRKAYLPQDCLAAPDGFSARISGFAQSGISVMHLDVGPCEMLRESEVTSGADPDLLVLYFVLSGKVGVQQDGRSASIGPGDAALCVGERPYRLVANQRHSVLAYKVRRDFLSRSASLENVTARSLVETHSAAPLVVDLARGIWEHAQSLDTSTIHRVTQSLVDMTETAFGLFILEEEQALSARKATLRRIKRFVESNLSNEELSPYSVSRTFSLSPRYISRLFSEEGTTLSRFIWESRLRLAAKRLLDPMYARHSIAAIGYLHGFKNQSHFSASLREKYNCSPSGYRMAGRRPPPRH